jgi:aminopeptidase N
MPLYTISFAASPGYEAFDLPPTATGVELGGAVTPVRRRDAERHIAAAGRAVDWMSANIGPFPWDERLGFAEIPGYPGGFEHTAAVWLGSPVLDGTVQGDYVAIHEAVHHWFGNDVRVADWEHLWLSEGLTDWTTRFAIMEEELEPSVIGAMQRRIRTDAAAMSRPAAGAPAPGPLRFADAGEIVAQIGNNLLFFYAYGAAFLEMVDQRLRRGHDTDLVALLARWHARHTASAVTTEMFRDFLIEETGDAGWTELFEQWVYATPAPMLEASDYTFAGGTASFRLRRDAAAGQDLPAIEVIFVSGGTRHPVTVALGPTDSEVTVTTPMASPPTSIEIDPTGLYILGLRTAAGWTGPAVTNGS